MRSLSLAVLAATTLAALSSAKAADLDSDFLRGPDYDPAPAYAAIDWSGVYVGGHAGYTSAALAQRNVLRSRLQDYFRYRDVESQFTASNLIALPGSRATGASFGGFAGFNVQYDDVVLGIEADYTRFGRSAISSASIGRIYSLSNGISETVDIAGQSRTEIEDYGTIRARAGYAMGSFLPFITGGLAIGRVTANDTAAVQNYGYNQQTYAANQALPASQRLEVYNHGYYSFNPNAPTGFGTIPYAPEQLPGTSIRTKTVGGAALGAGLEYAITSNILLRGEYQYVLFQSFNGHRAELNTIRGGAALKF
ncbi:outer membrane protein [Methylobacterium trifolii]